MSSVTFLPFSRITLVHCYRDSGVPTCCLLVAWAGPPVGLECANIGGVTSFEWKSTPYAGLFTPTPEGSVPLNQKKTNEERGCTVIGDKEIGKHSRNRCNSGPWGQEHDNGP